MEADPVADKKRKREIIVPEDENDYESTTGNETIDSTEVPKVDAAAPVVSSGFDGFSAYAKSNPFADAIASNGSKNAFALFGKVNSTMPPPISMPSPKSPKVNPFSSPSPVHNPFMTIVESKDDLWKTMANDKLSAEEASRKSFFGSSSSKPVKSVFQQQSESQSTGVAPSAGEGSDDEDGVADADDNDDSKALDNQSFVKYAMPENVVVITGEEQDNCLLQVRAKLFRLHVVKPAAGTSSPASKDAPSSSSSSATADSATPISKEEKETTPKPLVPKIPASGVFLFDHPDKTSASLQETSNESKAEWVEVGIGPVKLLQSYNADNKSKSSGRLVMRREEKKGGIGTKLLLNARISQFTKVSKQTDKVVRLFCLNYAEIGNGAADSDGISGKVQTYLLKTKTNQESDDIIATISMFISSSVNEAESQ